MNIGNCKDANKTIFEIADGEKVECPTCHKDMLVEVKGGGNTKLIGGIVAAVIVLGGAGAYIAFSGNGEEAQLQSLNLNKTSLECVVGLVDTLIVSNEPADASATYVWSSDNEAVATVNNGLVTMLSEGNATITVKAQGDDDIFSTCVYTVVVPEPVADSEVTEPATDNPETTPKAIEETPAVRVSNKANLSWASYDGPMSGGKPHGLGGILVVKSKHSIDLKNGSTLDVNPGDKIANTKFTNGALNQGELQRKNGERKYFVVGG